MKKNTFLTLFLTLQYMNGNIHTLLLAIIACLIIYQLFFADSQTKQCPACDCTMSTNNCKCPSCGTPEEEKKIIVNVNNDENLPPIVNPAREYDYRTFNDPLVPPYKRSDYDHSFPPPGIPPIATRGYPTAFKKMGLLTDKNAPNDDKYKFMIIMGRQTYPGSNYYDYYVVENSDESALKFDMKNMHKELNDDDEVEIPDLNKTYTVKLDRDLGFRYTPFVF